MDSSGFDRLAGRIPKYGDLLLRIPIEVKEQAFDIHVKSGQPVSVCGRDGVFFLGEDGAVTRALTDGLKKVSPEEMKEIFVGACAHSVFSHEHELRKGYIDLGDSCRAGVCGTAVLENGQVKSVRDVTSLTFRIPREIRGCGDRLFLEGADLRRGLLIAGEPSSGKTTLLRDVALSISSGKFQPSRRVAVLDQRGEIGGGFDLGPCADVLLGYPKRTAFDIAVRMLSPEYIVCDELSPEDLETVRQAAFSGAALIASVHAFRQELLSRPLCRALLESGAFRTVACLVGRAQPGEIDSMEVIGEEGNESLGGGSGNPERAVPGPARGEEASGAGGSPF